MAAGSFSMVKLDVFFSGCGSFSGYAGILAAFAQNAAEPLADGHGVDALAHTKVPVQLA